LGSISTFSDGLGGEGCPHCTKIRQASAGALDSVVYETRHSITVLGDHQFFPGYCLVIAKRHIREMHDLPINEGLALFTDVLYVGRIIDQGFKCLKMNYVSLGNVNEHLHWHVIPRYLSDPDHQDHPWKNSHLFSNYPTTSESILKIKDLFKRS
jgi:diadenosine tetraphosphate (Ap4A) HIT family hydrolase